MSKVKVAPPPNSTLTSLNSVQSRPAVHLLVPTLASILVSTLIAAWALLPSTGDPSGRAFLLTTFWQWLSVIIASGLLSFVSAALLLLLRRRARLLLLIALPVLLFLAMIPANAVAHYQAGPQFRRWYLGTSMAQRYAGPIAILSGLVALFASGRRSVIDPPA